VGWIRRTGTRLELALRAFSIAPPRRVGPAACARDRTRALVLLPIIGFLQGVVLALADRWLWRTQPLTRSMIVVAIGLLLSYGIGVRGVVYTLSRKPFAGASSGRVLVWLFAALMVLLEIYWLSRIGAPPRRGRALVLAMLLSRWSTVPIGYGLKATGSDGLGIPFDGAITFGDFAFSSLIALGVAMTAYDLVALVAIVTVALTILGLRLGFSRLFGGVDGFALAAGAQVCEFATLGILSVIRL